MGWSWCSSRSAASPAWTCRDSLTWRYRARSGRAPGHGSSAEAGEEVAQVVDYQVRVGGVGEVTATVELGVPDDVVVPCGEGPDGPEVLGEDRERRRDLVRRVPVAGTAVGVLVVVAGA